MAAAANNTGHSPCCATLGHTRCYNSEKQHEATMSPGSQPLASENFENSLKMAMISDEIMSHEPFLAMLGVMILPGLTPSHR